MRNLSPILFGMLALAALAASACSSQPGANGPGNAVRGRPLAIEDCAACHQVTADQKPPAPVLDPDLREQIVAPSFAAMSEKYAGNRAGLRNFIHQPQYPMREQQFLPQDLDDIVAYIQSLPHSK